jgi:N-acetylneuraminate synthase
LKFKAERLVVLGNGETRSKGLAFAVDESLPVVSINHIDDYPNVVFAVVTKPKMLMELESKNIAHNPIIVPLGFPHSENSVSLPISEFEYIEGLAVNDSNRIGFREDFVLITILDLLNVLAKEEQEGNQPLEIHLFGFDFKVTPINAFEIEDLFLQSLLARQKSIFEMLLQQEKPFGNLTLVNNSNTSIKVNHISAKEISKQVPFVTESSLSQAISKNIELQKGMFLRAAAGEVQIIAELTNNHLGDTDRLTEMVKLCKSQGASIVKIQKRDINVLYTQEERESGYSSPFGNTLGDYRAGVELSIEQIEYLTVLCAELDIPWFTSVLDLPSLQLMDKFKPLSIKAPSTISEHKNFLRTANFLNSSAVKRSNANPIGIKKNSTGG